MQRLMFVLLFVFAIALGTLPRSAAADTLCDPSYQNCRTRLLDLIRAENVGIDVAFWFMEDPRYTNEIIKRWQAGVPVRVLMDTQANSSQPLNRDRLAELKNAGIPMRERTGGGILHWKMMLFTGQNTVEFSAANYSEWAFVPVVPYAQYTDEVIYYSTKTSVVNSFRTKFDDLWTNTSTYSNYANVSGSLVRYYDTYPKDAELNFGPKESFRTRAVNRYNAETAGIDVIMYRITDRAHSDAMINAIARGVPVRLITEPKQYRDRTRLWHSWNVDRMYAAGVRIRHRKHAGLLHQKSVLLKGQRMTIFGSSNWTSPSSDSQEEHNYFTKDATFFQYFTDNFERKWNNSNPAGAVETEPFVPLPPDKPAYVSPADGATDQPTSITLTWHGGYWAHLYDIYLGTAPDPPLFAADQALGPSQGSTEYKSVTLSGLAPGTTYYWRVVSKTMANVPASGAIRSFTTSGTAQPPPASGEPGAGDVLMYASKASVITGGWRVVSDGTAAGGSRLHHPDAGAGKISSALASPTHYFEMTFIADAGKPYRLWLRGRAQSDSWANDSVHVQFDRSVNSSNSAIWRIGSTSSAQVNLEDCSGCGLSSWGWQDNGWGVGVLGPVVYFSASGTQRIRIQTREDGFSIDQILLSPQAYLNTPPGATKNDTTILSESSGGGSSPPPEPDASEQVLYASRATITGSGWFIQSDPSAAGGARIQSPNAGAAKVSTALASPLSYFELTFDANAGSPYHLWLRLRALDDHWANDSVHVQFTRSVTASGDPIYRIGTTSAAPVNLEDCSGCELSGWGWQDNGWGTNVMGPAIYFAEDGTQRLRVQVREDGVAIDQIVVSSSTYLNSAPGALKDDSTILPESGS